LPDRIAAGINVMLDLIKADVDTRREQFQAPDAAELDGSEIPGPPAGWPG